MLTCSLISIICCFPPLTPGVRDEKKRCRTDNQYLIIYLCELKKKMIAEYLKVLQYFIIYTNLTSDRYFPFPSSPVYSRRWLGVQVIQLISAGCVF